MILIHKTNHQFIIVNILSSIKQQQQLLVLEPYVHAKVTDTLSISSKLLHSLEKLKQYYKAHMNNETNDNKISKLSTGSLEHFHYIVSMRIENMTRKYLRK